MSNRNLFIGLMAMILLYALSKAFTGDKSNSFDSLIVALDTARVDKIHFTPAGDQALAFELRKSGNTWEAIQGDLKVTAPVESIENILASLSDLRAKKLITKDPAKFTEYEIEDDKASRVTLWQGKKQAADLLVGGFRFSQAARTASSFVRKFNQQEVYEIDGFVSMGLKARFDQFRDKQLVKAEKEEIDALDWTDKAGQKHGFRKIDGQWYFAGMELLDSLSFAAYLDGLVNAQGSSFSERKTTAGLNALESLSISGAQMTSPVVISAYSGEDPLKPFLLHSTANPESIFIADSLGVYKKVFSDLSQFSPYGQ